MSTVRQSAPGATRACPHCRTRILESASICPACKKYLRFDPGAAARAVPTFSPLKVEGTIKHPDNGQAWEYSVLVTVRNEKGEELARHVVGVGALHSGDQRTFSLDVEVFAPGGSGAPTHGN